MKVKLFTLKLSKNLIFRLGKLSNINIYFLFQLGAFSKKIVRKKFSKKKIRKKLEKFLENHKVQFLMIYLFGLIRLNSILEFAQRRLYIKIKSKFAMNQTTRKRLHSKSQKKSSLKFKYFHLLGTFRIWS